MKRGEYLATKRLERGFSEKQLAGSELINKVQSYIDEQCPIGADVTVTTATAVSINVTFSADVDESTIESIKANIRNYLRVDSCYYSCNIDCIHISRLDNV